MISIKGMVVLFAVSFSAGCVHQQIIPSIIVHKNNNYTFTYQNPSAASVNLAGSFNNWNNTSTSMQKVDKRTWTLTLHLNPGIYYYQFIVNGKTPVTPPDADSYVPDGFGGKNAVIVVIKTLKKGITK